jgi:hypothetical protein
MSIEAQIRSAADTLVLRLAEDARQQVDAVVTEWTAAAAATAEAHQQALERLRAELEEAHAAAFDALRAEHALELQAARAEHALALEDAATSRAEADRALAQAEEALAESVRQVEAVRHAETHAAARQAAPADEAPLAHQDAATELAALARAVAAMDQAETLSEVLDALSAGLHMQAPRAVVLVLKGDVARVWRQSGFDEPLIAAGKDIALDEHGDLRAVVEAAVAAQLDGRGAETPLLGVATLPEGATGMAVPVSIGGQVAALVYADEGTDTGRRAAAGWGELVEVLARHAGRCLEALTAMRASGYARPQRTAVVVPMPPHLTLVERPTLDQPVSHALAQAQRVARLLVSEIRLSREADIRLGREAGDLAERLATDIGRARAEYLSRVSEALPGRDALFDDEVVRTLASGDADLLRRPTGS